MKHKGIVVFPLALLLSVSALSVTTFAETSEKTISADTAEQETKQETQKESQTEIQKESQTETQSESQKETQKETATDKNSQAPSENNGSKPEKNGKRTKKEEVAEPENAIGKDAAKQKALDDAKVTADQAGKVRSRVSKLDDGTVIYKVRFSYNGMRYSYQIDATTGKVIDKSSKAVTEDEANRSGEHGKHGKKDAGDSESASEDANASA